MDVGRHRRGLFPRALRAQLRRRGDRVLFALGEHAEEAAVANDRGALRFPTEIKFRKTMRRPHDAPMQHVRQHHVLHVARLAGELGRQVAPRRAGADDAVGRRRLQRRRARDLALDVRQLPVGDAAARAADRAVVDRELGRLAPSTLRRAAEHQRAQLGAGHAQRLAALLDRQAAGGHAFVRAVGGARRQHADSRKIDTQLLGGDLRQRGEDALPELDLAARDRHRAVALEVHALRQAARVGQRRRLLSEHRGSPSPRGCASRSGRGSCRALARISASDG